MGLGLLAVCVVRVKWLFQCEEVLRRWSWVVNDDENWKEMGMCWECRMKGECARERERDVSLRERENPRSYERTLGLFVSQTNLVRGIPKHKGQEGGRRLFPTFRGSKMEISTLANIAVLCLKITVFNPIFLLNCILTPD